jgi:benzoyl-CoA-dihydrodiol lyase
MPPGRAVKDLDMESTSPAAPISFETHPSRYHHWKLEVPNDGSGVARLDLGVDEAHPLRPGYPLKLNSYDLSVDIELADALQRIRFEHPEVRAVVIGSSKDRIFCAGANIHMLASSTHPFKVNFCKFTNETRLYLEDASAGSGLKFLAACSGPTAGGGYELALACDDIVLIDDGSSTVSLPEVPLLGVLPGTGGLTRVVDKRAVRRDRADVFATTAEGIKGKRAVEWKLVDATAPRSKFAALVAERAKKLAASPVKSGAGITLDELRPEVTAKSVKYRHVELSLDPAHRTATITMRAPEEVGAPEQGAQWWPLRAFRELDDALLRLRFNHEDVGLVLLRTRGDAHKVLEIDRTLEARKDEWQVREVTLHMARVLRRLDSTARSFFAVLDPESCFTGCLLELALAADRRYMLDDAKRPVRVQADCSNSGMFPTSNGRSRLAMLGIEEELDGLRRAPLEAQAADEAGLVTVLADELDFDDTLRLAIEERASLSPDALTGMEASFRCVGPETVETKIFGRLSAWQNWIFTRPNATGEKGALSLYGKPERPSFDWRRT